MGIYNTRMYENAERAEANQRVALETLSYHATAPVEEANKLKVSWQPQGIPFELKDHL